MGGSSYSNMLGVIKDALASMAAESLQSSFASTDVFRQILGEIIKEQSRITVQQLPLILDALSGVQEFLKSEASASLDNDLAISVDVESVTAAFRAAQPYMTSEQQKECSALSASPGKATFPLTFERIIALLTLLCTVLSLIHGYKDDTQKEREFELKERAVVAIERIADSSEKSSSEDETGDTVDIILKGIYALGDGLEAINQQFQTTDIEIQDVDNPLDMAIDAVCNDCLQQNTDAQN